MINRDGGIACYQLSEILIKQVEEGIEADLAIVVTKEDIKTFVAEKEVFLTCWK